MAFVVVQRTTEIGVRMALVATPSGVMRMALTRAALLTAAGVAIGSAGAWYFGAGVRASLFGVETNDVDVFALVWRR